jgi:hypothetical protein
MSTRTRGRPSVLPRARARSRPAVTRSRMMSTELANAIPRVFMDDTPEGRKAI